MICEPNGKLFKKIKKFKPHVVFNALHGRFGEDGYIQALLESIKIRGERGAPQPFLTQAIKNLRGKGRAPPRAFHYRLLIGVR